MRRDILLALLVALSVPSTASANERVTAIATGRIMTNLDSNVETARFILDECKTDQLEGYTAALINVERYRGKTLRIHAVSAEFRLDQLHPGWNVAEGMECFPSNLTDRHPKPRGIAFADKPFELVVTGVYLRLQFSQYTHLYEHFRVDLIEFD